MARVALVSHDVQAVQGRAGGVGTFVTNWARLLKSGGDDVTIVFAHQEVESPGLDARWIENYRSWGIGFIELHSDPPSAERWPDVWAMRLSEKLHPLLSEYDIVYFQDWANLAFHTVRTGRFSTTSRPTCITVLHGPSNWVRVGNRRYPAVPGDLHLEFVERYAAEHSDFVIAPSRYMLDWLKNEGWKFRSRPVVLGLPFQPAAEPAFQPGAWAPKRVIFFGRLETRKGFTLFASGLLLMLSEHPAIADRLEEVVLLGHEDEPGSVAKLTRRLGGTGLRITHVGNLDTQEAAGYMREHSADAIVVIASAFENFPYSVIEASLIPGLNMICSRGGGIPEVLADPGDTRLFDPHPRSLAAKLYRVLTEPPTDRAAPYDYASANQAWLNFHRDVVSGARIQEGDEDRIQPSVCVCIPYFNKARYFPQVLECLERQTISQFTVVAVDDGSDEPESKDVFDRMAFKYRVGGWAFLHQENAFVDAARNVAAAQTDSEYLFFLDADDLIPPHALERMLAAAAISGVDCLVSGSVLFTGGEPPYRMIAKYMPLGASLVAGLIEPIIYGGPMILVRRSAFEAIGGYRAVRGAAHEDWELQARLAMEGFDTDVLPEYLHQYRQLPDGLAKTTDSFLAKRRIIDSYEARFSRIGMHGMAGLVYALYRRCQELEGAVREEVPVELRMRLHERLTKLLSRQP
jgi:O-antigen biosynthesis protein